MGDDTSDVWPLPSGIMGGKKQGFGFAFIESVSHTHRLQTLGVGILYLGFHGQGCSCLLHRTAS